MSFCLLWKQHLSQLLTASECAFEHTENGLFSNSDREKLIAQAYDGASVMTGERAGVQQKVREHLRNAHYVHCYAH